MVKVNVKMLEGKALDYAVSICEGMKPVIRRNQFNIAVMVAGANEYSADWSQGGPIIEHEKIMINHIHSLAHLKNEFPKGYWCANGNFRSHTPLIAAMRCYVASKLGDIVDIPDELV